MHNIEAQREKARLITSYCEVINEYAQKLREIEAIDDKDIGVCKVCGKIYDTKRLGVVCSTSCYKEGYL